MSNFWSALSIRWKLQIAFMAVTMVTTLYNRWLAFIELEKQLAIAKSGQVSGEVLAKMQQAYDAFFFNSFWESGLQFIVQFFIIGLFARYFVVPLLELIESLKHVENGDLTHPVKVRSADEYGKLESQFNNMLERLNKLISSVDQSSAHMGQSAYQISTVSKEIEEVSRSEQARSKEVNEATQQLYENSENVRMFSTSTQEKAESAKNRAMEGREALKSNIAQMNEMAEEVTSASNNIQELANSTQTIVGILGNIREIAEQTNLLALNAAIEAARAGEQGRGFAVVADEVRSLAKRTTDSAGEVQEIIDTLTARVTRSVTMMDSLVASMNENKQQTDSTYELLRAMEEDSVETAQFNSYISEACDEQLKYFSKLNETLDSLFETLRESGTKIGNTANISNSLFKLTENLNQQLAGLKFNNDESDLPEDCRREAKRVESHQLVSIVSGKEKLNGLTQDISETGMKLALKGTIKKGNIYDIEVRMPTDELEEYAKQTPLQVQAIVTRDGGPNNEGSNVYGLQFTKIEPNQQQRLRKCVEFFAN